MSLIEINWRPETRQLRTFGVICAVACLGLGIWTAERHHLLGMTLAPITAARVSYVLWGIAVTAAALAWVAPRALWPLYVALTAISLPIGFVVSYLLMATLFYAVLTPYGLLFRLIGRDPLTRRFDRSASSYWVARQPVTDVNRYFRQF